MHFHHSRVSPPLNNAAIAGKKRKKKKTPPIILFFKVDVKISNIRKEKMIYNLYVFPDMKMAAEYLPATPLLISESPQPDCSRT